MTLFEVLFIKSSLLVIPPAFLLFCLYNIRRELWESKWGVLALAATLLWVFRPIIFQGHFPVSIDQSILLLPVQAGWREGMLTIEDVPFWHPLNANGYSLLANPVSYYFYPLNWVYLLAEDVQTAIGMAIVAHFFLAAIFMVALIRDVHGSVWAATAAGAAYTLNAWFSTFIVSPSALYVFSATWLPLVLLFLLRYLRHREPGPSLAGLVIAMSASFIMFNVCYVIVLTGALWFLVYLAFRFRSRRLRLPSKYVGFLAAAGLFGTLIAANALPVTDLLDMSSDARLSQPVAENAGWRMAPYTWPSLFTHATDRQQTFAHRFSPGWVVLILAAVSIIQLFTRSGFRGKRWFFSASVLGLIFAALLVTKTQPYGWMRLYLPFYDHVSLIPGTMVLFIFSLSCLSAVGIDGLLTFLSCRWRWIPGLLLIALILFVGVKKVTYPHFPYEEQINDYPHLRYARDTLPQPWNRLASADARPEIYITDSGLNHFGLQGYNCKPYQYTVNRANHIEDPALGLAWQRFMALAGVGLVLSTNPENPSLEKPAAAISWPNWPRHGESLVSSRLQGTYGRNWNGLIYAYPSPLPAQPRYRLYNRAILFIGPTKDTGRLILDLLKSPTIDPFSTLLMEWSGDHLDAIPSTVREHIKIVCFVGNQETEITEMFPQATLATPQTIRNAIQSLEPSPNLPEVEVLTVHNSHVLLRVETKGILFAGSTYVPGWCIIGSQVESPGLRGNYNFQAYGIPQSGEYRLVYSAPSITKGLWLFHIGTMGIVTLTWLPFKRRRTRPSAASTNN